MPEVNERVVVSVSSVSDHQFWLAVEILKNWLEEYERDLKRKNPETQPVAS